MLSSLQKFSLNEIGPEKFQEIPGNSRKSQEKCQKLQENHILVVSDMTRNIYNVIHWIKTPTKLYTYYRKNIPLAPIVLFNASLYNSFINVDYYSESQGKPCRFTSVQEPIYFPIISGILYVWSYLMHPGKVTIYQGFPAKRTPPHPRVSSTQNVRRIQ